MGGQQMGGQQMHPAFEDHLTNELRIALEDLNDVAHIAEWCAKECAMAGPHMAECARVCRDIAELAEINERLIARDSMFGPEAAELFVTVASAGLPEIRRHEQQHPHVTETIFAIERAIDSCESALETVRQSQQMGGQQGSTGGRQMGGQQMGGQQMGGQQGSMGGQQPTERTFQQPPGQ